MTRPVQGSRRVIAALFVQDRQLTEEVEKRGTNLSAFLRELIGQSLPAQEFPPADACVDDHCSECGEYERECDCLDNE